MRVTISVPDHIFRAAERQKVSRTRIYVQALEARLKTKRAKGVTEALNAVYATENSDADPFLTAAAYHLLAKEKW